MANRKQGARFIWLALAAASTIGAYWFWPSGIGDVALSHLTLGMIGNALVSVLCGVVALAFLGSAFE